MDVSQRSIAEATGKAATLGISNITFEHCDVTKSVPGREYDAVVDCDTISSLGDVFAAFRVIRSVLAPGGVLVSVASLPCAHDAKQFVATLNLAGLQVGHCEWVRCSDLGRQQFFLGMMASLQEADQVRQIDFDQQYRQVGEYCNSLLMASDTRPLRRTVVTPKQHSEASHEKHGQVAASDTGGSHMLGVTNTKYAFGQHLSRIGFVLDQPPQIVAQALAEHMGPQRYAQYRQITAGAVWAKRRRTTSTTSCRTCAKPTCCAACRRT